MTTRSDSATARRRVLHRLMPVLGLVAAIAMMSWGLRPLIDDLRGFPADHGYARLMEEQPRFAGELRCLIDTLEEPGRPREFGDGFEVTEVRFAESRRLVSATVETQDRTFLVRQGEAAVEFKTFNGWSGGPAFAPSCWD